MVWIKGGGNEGVYYNPRLLSYLGLTQEGMTGPGAAARCLHPEDAARVTSEWKVAFGGPGLYQSEFRVRRADGAYRWHLAVGEAVLDGEGRIRHWIGTLTDIHDRKLAELAVERTREELARRVRALQRMGELSAIVAAARGQAQVWEAALDAVCEVLGASRASLLLFDDGGVMRFRAWRGLSDAYREAVEGHSPWSPGARDAVPLVIEDSATAPELAPFSEAVLGEGIRSLAFIPLASQEGVLGKFMVYYDEPRRLSDTELGIARAIADHVALTLVRERERRDLARALEAADRASRAKSDFVASISHELRTPLNAIIGYTDLLLDGIPEPATPRVLEKVARIQQSGHQLRQIIDEILHFTRLETGHERVEPRSVAIGDLLAEVRAVIEPLVGEAGLQLRVRDEHAPRALVTDPRKVRQVLINLLGNAVKFTAEGWVDLEVADENEMVSFRVRDSGRGISPQDMERIFEPFWQGSTRSGRGAGTGLGLAISQRMTELLGGRISVESEPGRGSCFTVRIPARPA
jgi:PAS domain S-box-containing protein